MKVRPTVLYLETSFWLRLTDRQNPVQRRATATFLKWARKRFRLLISPEVRAEVHGTRSLALRHPMRRKIDRARPRTVTGGIRVDRLVAELVLHGVLTPRHLADLFHIGYALLGGADYLVTWDVGDLAREGTRRWVTEFCVATGRKALMIGTPVEVARWLGTRIGR
jgi:predicted nucleic acid-binding protein